MLATAWSSSSESTSCPEGHYDPSGKRLKTMASIPSESTSCPEGHYDDWVKRAGASDASAHQNPPPARKGITTAMAIPIRPRIPDQNPPPARKGITTALPGRRPGQDDRIRIHLLPGRALRPSTGMATVLERPRSESTSCPEGHYDVVPSAPVDRSMSSESTSCPEGHYDDINESLHNTHRVSESTSCPEGHYDSHVP